MKTVIAITGLLLPQTAVAARSSPKGASSGQFLYWTLNESDQLPHSSVKQSPMSFREVWLIAQLCYTGMHHRDSERAAPIFNTFQPKAVFPCYLLAH